MTTNTLLEAWRASPPERLPVNRVAACLPELVISEGSYQRWTAVAEEPERPDLETSHMWLARVQRAAQRVRVRKEGDPVRAALGVLERPAVSHWRAYLNDAIEARLSTVDEVFAERIDKLVRERVDAALAERDRVRTRADAVLGRLLAQLEATTEPDMDLSPEEEKELWQMVDFSDLDEPEE
jgi:hypothetical protein